MQLKHILNRYSTYEMFLSENFWVMNYFQNVVIHQKKGYKLAGGSWLGDIIERILGIIQLTIMKPHQTIELISDSQLWFYPKDFEKTLKKHITLKEDISESAARAAPSE